jgi:hypothetical protein
MAKRYSPVRVKNPTSSQHLVKLRPGQDISLLFDKEVAGGEVNLEIVSDYLDCKLKENDNRHEFDVWQTSAIEGWSSYSSIFLGEIWAEYQSNISKISVVLDCVNQEKEDHVTIINPDCFDVRVKPHQILEFVVYDLEFGSCDEWNCDWRPMKDVHLEQIGYDHLSLQAWHQYYNHGDDDPGYRFARFPRTEIEPSPTQWTRQHHFWFRFDKSVLDFADVGVTHIGNFVIHGISDKFIKSVEPDHTQYHMSLYLDTKKFKRGRVLHTLGLKKKNEYSHYTYQNQGQSRIHKPRVVKETLPISREVGISNIVSSSLEEGCKVISAKPSWEPSQKDYEHDDDFYEWQKDLDGWANHNSHRYHPHHMD